MFKKIASIVTFVICTFLFSLNYAAPLGTIRVNALPQPWVLITDVLLSKTMHSLIDYNNRLFLIGVDSDNKTPAIYRFSGSTQNPTWSLVSNGILKEVNELNTLAVINNKLLVSGSIDNPQKSQPYLAEYQIGKDEKPMWTSLSIEGLPKRAIITKLIDFNGKLAAKLIHRTISRDAFNYPIYLYNNVKKTWSPMLLKDEEVADIISFHNKLYASSVNGLYVYKDNNWQAINNGLPDYIDEKGHVIKGTYSRLVIFNDTLFVDGRLADVLTGDRVITRLMRKGIVYAYNGNDSAPLWSEMTNGLPIKYDFTTATLLKYNETPTVVVKDIIEGDEGYAVFSLGEDKIWRINENFPKDIPISELISAKDKKRLYMQVIENNRPPIGKDSSYPAIYVKTLG